ncbi:MAG: TlpA family protein disulfide reductase [Phycisphaerales bacterium]
MHARLNALLASIAVTPLFFGPLAPLQAAPPTDAQIEEAIASIKKASEGLTKPGEKAAAERKAAEEAAKGLSLAEVSFAQVEMLLKGGLLSGIDAKTAIAPRLAELAKAPTKEGVQAALWRISLAPGAPAKSREEFEAAQAAKAPWVLEALKHPAAVEFVNTSNGDALFRSLGTLPAAVVKDQKVLEAVEPLLTNKLSFDSAVGLSAVIDRLADEANGLDKATRVKFLDKVAASASAALASKGEITKSDESKAKRLGDIAKSAKSAWARGELLNNQAPEIKFTWSSTNASPKSLSELKGKVVLLDFWATWCGPCIASFPKIKELQARYQGFPVEIVGVTSLQGFSMDYSEKPSKRIDCKDDAAKEMGLMTEFMKNKDMTWTVVFSDDSCFNPNFGVKGIPHLAILAPDGTVRWNELRPGDPAEEAEKIDALLKEFKLPMPEKAMEKAEKPKKD